MKFRKRYKVGSYILFYFSSSHRVPSPSVTLLHIPCNRCNDLSTLEHNDKESFYSEVTLIPWVYKNRHAKCPKCNTKMSTEDHNRVIKVACVLRGYKSR